MKCSYLINYILTFFKSSHNTWVNVNYMLQKRNFDWISIKCNKWNISKTSTFFIVNFTYGDVAHICVAATAFPGPGSLHLFLAFTPLPLYIGKMTQTQPQCPTGRTLRYSDQPQWSTDWWLTTLPYIPTHVSVHTFLQPLDLKYSCIFSCNRSSITTPSFLLLGIANFHELENGWIQFAEIWHSAYS